MPTITIAEAVSIIIPLDKAADEAKGALLAKQQELGLAICPFKVGDIVPCCGWSHQGKKSRVIGAMLVPSYAGRMLWEWQVDVEVLRKDGKAIGNSSWRQCHHDRILSGVDGVDMGLHCALRRAMGEKL